MNNALKITAFAAALAATFGTAYGVGRGVDPLVAAEDRPAQQHGGHGGGEEGGPKAAADQVPGGLQISEGGYTLDLATPTVRAGDRAEIRFAVKDESGRKVTAYQREHGKELHFILASTDLTQYRHLHPVRAADGTWSTPSTFPMPAATGCSPTSPRRQRVPRTSRWARIWPYPVPTAQPLSRPRTPPSRWTATASRSAAISGPAGAAN